MSALWIPPMLAKIRNNLPSDTSHYGFEIKWDGIRTSCYVNKDHIRLISRNGHDITHRYPELIALKSVMSLREVILDGEIVMMTAEGVPSFSLLQSRMNLDNKKSIERLSDDLPVTYIIFDLLAVDGRPLINLPYHQRRQLLDELNLNGKAWNTPAYHTGDSQAFLQASQQLKLEGIVLKKLDSIYLPGKRSEAWIKLKNRYRQEFVVGGWSPGEGRREGKIGSLLLGYYNLPPEEAGKRKIRQKLIYAGSCGSGFSENDLATLHPLLEKLKITANPFATVPPKADAIFVRPELVAECSFTEWTLEQTLRHPVFHGLRYDKDPFHVMKE